MGSYFCAFRTSRLAYWAGLWSSLSGQACDAPFGRQSMETRRLLRQILVPSPLAVPDNCLPSTLSVEWLTLVDAGKRDFDLCADLKQRGLAILPGRHFYWASHTQSHRNAMFASA
jgi:hypothetical protein